MSLDQIRLAVIALSPRAASLKVAPLPVCKLVASMVAQIFREPARNVSLLDKAPGGVSRAASEAHFSKLAFADLKRRVCFGYSSNLGAYMSCVNCWRYLKNAKSSLQLREPCLNGSQILSPGGAYRDPAEKTASAQYKLFWFLSSSYDLIRRLCAIACDELLRL